MSPRRRATPTRIAYELLLAVGLAAFVGAARGDPWPAWRGPTGQGICFESNLPVRWSPTQHVKWKVPLPGPGNSTPIVWGDRVFLTQAWDAGKNRSLFCIDRRDGAVLWKRTVSYPETEWSEGRSPTPYASASPVTDGERVIVFYDEPLLVCYDFQGRELWRRKPGAHRNEWNAASPVLWGDLCFVNCGPSEKTFLLALDKRTGRTVWKVDLPFTNARIPGRGETFTASWSTPLVAEWNGRADLVVPLPYHVYGFDPTTGTERWRCGGLGAMIYPSPLAADGVVVAMAGNTGSGIATRLGGSGDITETHRLWKAPRAQNRISSGVIAGKYLYLVGGPGIAECVELRTGRRVWRERLARRACWSSLVLADQKLYVLDSGGVCIVFAASPTFKLVARNRLDETTGASIAVSDGELFIRTHEHLWCIAAAK